jgi:hypothetical protein
MKTIFDKTDFSLCDVPAPKGYPQSQTHVGVFPTRGVELLTTSPYPNVKRPKWAEYVRAAIRKSSFGLLCKSVCGESFENPCIYSSGDGVSFKLMQSHPLMETPEAYYGLPAFNSDPDLYAEGDTIYVLNRAIFRTKLTPGKLRDEYDIRIYLIKGLFDEGRFKYISTNLLKETTDLIVSPCLTKYRGEYVYTSLWTNCYNDGESFEGLKYIKACSIDGLYQNENWSTIKVNTDKWIPWHMSVFAYKDRLYSIVACVESGKPLRCWQMLGVFDEELKILTIYETPLTDYNSYRGAAYVDETGMFVLYSTTVGEKISGGKSVDGREVIMAKMPFDELLNKLRTTL